MLWSLSRNARGSPRNARSTTVSNSFLVTATARRKGSEASDALAVDDVAHGPDGGHDALQLLEIGDLDHEVVDALAVVGHHHLGLGDVAVLGRDRAGDLREQARPVAPDVDRDADRPAG